VYADQQDSNWRILVGIGQSHPGWGDTTLTEDIVNALNELADSNDLMGSINFANSAASDFLIFKQIIHSIVSNIELAASV
jgi:hypothetical protein